jgi:hypothetical protein
MRGPRIALALGLLALALPAAAASSLHGTPASTGLTAPTGLKGFMLRYDEPTKRTFPYEPSFAWAPSANASSYEFQVARSSTFRDSAVLYDNDTLLSPASNIPIGLPWASGNGTGYGFYARVRAVTDDGTTPWSKPWGFNLRWPNIPTPLPSPDGLLRWTPVNGADGYQVWEIGIDGTGATTAYDHIVSTVTNVLDERDWYTFHAASADSSWYKTIHWRVRAFRFIPLIATNNDTPRVTTGPWSPLYTNTNGARPVAPTPLALGSTVSDTIGTPTAPAVHGLMPGFTWTGNSSIFGAKAELYRVYVFSDSDCLNPVYVGAVTGSPAYAPRLSGPFALPTSQSALTAARTSVLATGNEGATYTADMEPTVASESLNPNTAAVDPLDPANLKQGAGTDPNKPDATTGSPTPSTGSAPVDPSQISYDSKWVDLWDTDWPSNGYYWTVVPVYATSSQSFTTTLVAPVSAGSTTITVSTPGLASGDAISVGAGGPTEELNSVASVSGNTITLGTPVKNNHGAGELVVRNSTLQYDEGELWQQACSSGRVMRFGKVSQPVVTGGGKPFVSGLGVNGKVVSGSSTRTFYGVPVIAWQPTLGADEYEIQWSVSSYPFTPAVDKIEPGTSSLMGAQGLGFKPGTYYYRVRGIDLQLPKKARGLGWSQIQKVTIASPSFVVSSK